MGENHIILTDDRILSFPLSPAAFKIECQLFATADLQTLADKIRFVRCLRKEQGVDGNTVPIADKAALKGVFFLTQTNSGEIQTRRAVAEEAIDRIIQHNWTALTRSNFYRYVLAYSSILPDNNVAYYLSMCNNDLRDTLRKVGVFEVVIPERWHRDLFHEASKFW